MFVSSTCYWFGRTEEIYITNSSSREDHSNDVFTEIHNFHSGDLILCRFYQWSNGADPTFWVEVMMFLLVNERPRCFLVVVVVVDDDDDDDDRDDDDDFVLHVLVLVLVVVDDVAVDDVVVGSLKLAEWISWTLFFVRLGHGENSRFLMVLLVFLRLLKTCGRRDTSRFFGRSASPTWTRGRCSIESSGFFLL